MGIAHWHHPGNFRTPGEVGQEFWDEEEEQEEEEEMDEDHTYTSEDESPAQRSTSTNADYTPGSPSAPPSSAYFNPGASETLQGPLAQAVGVQPHQYPAQTWHTGPVWTNNSYNTSTTDTRGSHNDSSINIRDFE